MTIDGLIISKQRFRNIPMGPSAIGHQNRLDAVGNRVLWIQTIWHLAI
jgi:hypothetical protein